MIQFLSVALGGAIGSTIRYLISLIKFDKSGSFPINTLIINVLGSFLIGLIVLTIGKDNSNPNLVLFLKVGVCGGFTTFSTFALETQGLLLEGKITLALIYMTLSFVLSIGVIFLAGALIRA